MEKHSENEWKLWLMGLCGVDSSELSRDVIPLMGFQMKKHMEHALNTLAYRDM